MSDGGETHSEIRAADGDETAHAGRRPTIGTVLGLVTLAWGAVLAARPLTDNSFLTHLATGRLILDRGSVPSTDPYSFTASGTDWTVQSWLASVVYAGAERLAGTAGLHAVVLVTTVGAASLVWRLSAPCRTVAGRALVVVVALGTVSPVWNERPYMVGVIGLGLVWLALDAEPGWRPPPVAMVPLFWVWANSHGSFPLGIGLVVAVVVGRRLEARPLQVPLRVAGYAVAGTLAAVIGPLGPKVLTFPVTALTRADILSRINEWKAPDFQSFDQRLFLVFALATLVGAARHARWSLVLPAAVFVAASLVAQRNMVLAVMVLVPVAASSLPRTGPFAAGLRSADRPSLLPAYVVVAGAALVVATVTAVVAPFGSLEAYPVRSLAWLDARTDRDADGGEFRVVTSDPVGNLLTVLDGEDAAVFIDDRVDMYPVEVVEAAFVLFDGGPTWRAVLDDADADVVVWATDRPLASLLAADPAWQIRYRETGWILACRRGSACDALA